MAYIARKAFTYKGVGLAVGDAWTPQGDAVDARLLPLGFVREVADADAIDVENLPFTDTAATLADAITAIDETTVGAVVGASHGRRSRR